MRDVRHDNLAQFMGACVDNPNICILFQYCPKGSLQVIHLTPLKAMAARYTCAVWSEHGRVHTVSNFVMHRAMFLFQDILENEDVKLDTMFVTSLVTDIAKVITAGQRSFTHA